MHIGAASTNTVFVQCLQHYQQNHRHTHADINNKQSSDDWNKLINRLKFQYYIEAVITGCH